MVKRKRTQGRKNAGAKGAARSGEDALKITGSTPYEFGAKGLTPYGGVLPMIKLLERLQLRSLVEERLTVKRLPVAMGI